jgi:hypothetical protein
LKRWFADVHSVAMLNVAAALIAARYLLMSFTEMNLYTALSPGVMFFGVLFGAFACQPRRAGNLADSRPRAP